MTTEIMAIDSNASLESRGPPAGCIRGSALHSAGSGAGVGPVPGSAGFSKGHEEGDHHRLLKTKSMNWDAGALKWEAQHRSEFEIYVYLHQGNAIECDTLICACIC